MKRQLGTSLLAVCAFTAIGLALNISGQSDLQARLQSFTMVPAARASDSLRSVSVELDAMLEWLSDIDRTYSSASALPVASSESLAVASHTSQIHRMLSNVMHTAVLSSNVMGLNMRVDGQREMIRRLSASLLQRRQLLESIPTLRPVDGPITSGFGMRFHPILHRRMGHTGVDIASPRGTPIQAAAGGTIVFAGRKHGYGNVVMIDHGFGYQTLYAHASELLVAVGDTVEQGQPVALVGTTGRSTGPHVHFEVIVDNVKVDPLPFLEWTTPWTPEAGPADGAGMASSAGTTDDPTTAHPVSDAL